MNLKKKSAQGVSQRSCHIEGAEWTYHKVPIPKCPHLSILEPPSNQIKYAYYCLSEQDYFVHLESAYPVTMMVIFPH